MGEFTMIRKIAQSVETYSSEEVIQLLNRVLPILKNESRLIKLPTSPLVFVGDTHGDWEATQSILDQFWRSTTVFVFLGDYVDRGSNQIENLNLLYELKRRYPKRLVLLRGNHESPKVNRQYGFFDAVQRTFSELAEQYWATFAHLPLAAVSPRLRIFAVHGGIPEQLKSIDEINELPREVEIEHPVIFQLLWNDPQEALKGFVPSFRGGRARNFGQDVAIDFMTRNNLDLIVRAHEVFPHGFHEFFDGRVMSLFSCHSYRCPVDGKAFHVGSTGNRELIPI